jgi:hypothetical protein
MMDVGPAEPTRGLYGCWPGQLPAAKRARVPEAAAAAAAAAAADMRSYSGYAGTITYSEGGTMCEELAAVASTQMSIHTPKYRASGSIGPTHGRYGPPACWVGSAAPLAFRARSHLARSEADGGCGGEYPTEVGGWVEMPERERAVHVRPTVKGAGAGTSAAAKIARQVAANGGSGDDGDDGDNNEGCVAMAVGD